jgi:hypothetical protein
MSLTKFTLKDVHNFLKSGMDFKEFDSRRLSLEKIIDNENISYFQKLGESISSALRKDYLGSHYCIKNKEKFPLFLDFLHKEAM